MKRSMLLKLLVGLFVGGQMFRNTAKIRPFMALFAICMALYGQVGAARPTHHSCFQHGDKPAWSCVRGWSDPDQPDAHRKPSDRKRPPDGYPAPEQDPK